MYLQCPLSREQAHTLVHTARAQALEQLQTQIASLHRAQMGPDWIHDTRVLTKRLRAWNRLLKPEVPDFYVRSEANLKAIGKQLSATRDQTVTQTKLCELTDLPAVQTLMQQAAIHCSEQAPEASPRDPHFDPYLCHTLENALALEQAHWETLTRLSIHSPERVIHRLHKTINKVTQLARSRHQPSAIEQHHQWRKWAKRLMFQLQLFEQAGLVATALTPLLKRLKKLTSQLGDEHDFSVLADGIAQSRPPFDRLDSAQAHALSKKILALQHRHFKKAKKHHRKLKSSLKALRQQTQ